MKHLLLKDTLSPGCPSAPRTNNTANTIVAKYICIVHRYFSRCILQVYGNCDEKYRNRCEYIYAFQLRKCNEICVFIFVRVP